MSSWCESTNFHGILVQVVQIWSYNAFDNFFDKERRKLNVVVHNLPENDSMMVAERSKRDHDLFKDVIKEGLNIIINPTRSFRAGKMMADKPRLLIVTLENEEVKSELLRMAPQLRHLTTWKRIYVTPDLSKKEREEGKKLREELVRRRQDGEENIMIKRGRIMKIPVDDTAAERGQGRKAAASDSRQSGPVSQAARPPAPAAEETPGEESSRATLQEGEPRDPDVRSGPNNHQPMEASRAAQPDGGEPHAQDARSGTNIPHPAQASHASLPDGGESCDPGSRNGTNNALPAEASN